MENYNLSMRFFKRSNGVYYVELKRGVWRSLKTRDEREAKVRFKEIQKEALLGKLVILDRTPSITLQEFTKDYVIWLEKNRAWGTCDRANLSLTKFIDAVGSQRQLSTIRDRDLENFIEYCKARKNKPSTINIEIRQIKAAFSKAVQWKLLKENPFKGFRQIKYHMDPPKFLNVEDIQKVFDVIGSNRKYRLIFALYAYTGARRQEIHRLTWADIGQDSIVLRGKGYKTRTIPTTESLGAILKEYTRGVGKLFDVSLKQMSKHIKFFLRKAGVGHIRPHDLRHTFASQLAMAGVDLRTIQELLGHTSFNTTLIYAHLSQSHLKRAVEKLPY
jgi:site-specific recombinase XerD